MDQFNQAPAPTQEEHDDLESSISAFAGKAIANNLTTSTEGYVLDARQGKALNDKIASASTSITGANGGNIRFFKWGKVVNVVYNATGTTTKTSDGWIKLGTAPTGYRPQYTIITGAIDNYLFHVHTIQISTNGDIQYYALANVAMQVCFCITYVVA